MARSISALCLSSNTEGKGEERTRSPRDTEKYIRLLSVRLKTAKQFFFFPFFHESVESPPRQEENI